MGHRRESDASSRGEYEKDPTMMTAGMQALQKQFFFRFIQYIRCYNIESYDHYSESKIVHQYITLSSGGVVLTINRVVARNEFRNTCK